MDNVIGENMELKKGGNMKVYYPVYLCSFF